MGYVSFRECILLYWVVATQTFFIFTPIPGEMIQFDKYFSTGLKPPTSIACFQEKFGEFYSGLPWHTVHVFLCLYG